MSPFAGLCPLSKANYIQLQGDKAVSVVSIGQQLLVLGHFEAVMDKGRHPKKNRFFLGNSPKQRTLPTHRTGLGLT